MPEFGKLLPPPPAKRRGIPLYAEKSEEQTRRDVYERYDELVVRQTALHLADEIHGGYPFQPLADHLVRWLPATDRAAVADIGCSVGRLIGDLASRNRNWDCYGVDYSYQMIRQARDYWVRGEVLRPNLGRFGYPTTKLSGHELPNLHFAQADAAALPFPDNSLDLLFSTFLTDRLADPFAFFTESLRTLRPAARLITMSPLNFLQREQWASFHPPMKILDPLLRQGWQLIDLTDPLLVDEPMDARGNVVGWRTLAFVLEKPGA